MYIYIYIHTIILTNICKLVKYQSKMIIAKVFCFTNFCILMPDCNFLNENMWPLMTDIKSFVTFVIRHVSFITI